MIMKKVKKWIQILSAIKFRNHNLQRVDPHDLEFYINAQKLFAINIDKSIFPHYIHRTILWDSREPISVLPAIKTVKKHTKEYKHIMWNKYATEKLVLSLFDHSHFYFQYSRKIMQADFARYLILYQYGGAYFDLDIKMYSSLNTLIEKVNDQKYNTQNKNEFCILFEEHRWKDSKEAIDEKDQPIRKFLKPEFYTESFIRVANYAMIATPKHPFIKRILELCEKRFHLQPKNDYDVLFITGPDVVSHVYATSKKAFLDQHNVFLIPREKHDLYIKHLCDGGWRS